MKEIAYISRSQGLVFDDDVLAIVRVSREHNRRAGITGHLLYDGTRFLQLIEGPDAVVDRLYARIEADPRHKDVRTLAESAVTQRSFPDWNMAYRRVNDILEKIGPNLLADGRFGADLKPLLAA